MDVRQSSSPERAPALAPGEKRRPRFSWGRFGAGLLTTGLLHWFGVPWMFKPLLERPERPVEVAFLDETPSDLDKLKDPAPEPPPLPKKPDRERDKPLANQRPREAKAEPPQKPEPKPEVAKLEKPPEPKPEPPKPPPPPEPPPPEPPPPQAHQKMVDQDKFPDEADNAEAKYLAQKNHRAARDQRALDTNLVRDMKGPTSSPVEKSDNQRPNLGAKDKKVAELQKRAGAEHQVVRSSPRSGDEGQAQKSAPGKLSMRGLTPRSVEQLRDPVKAREGVELRDDAAGALAAARQGTDGARAGSRARGKRYNFTLEATDYDKIVGESVARAERERAAKAEISHTEGRWARLQKKQEALRSSLENFTNESYVGRESELGTRAHPYAAFIATMHRSIHKLWAFGFLPSLETRGALDPYNDMTRYTVVAIVLTDSGEVESAKVIRQSGYLPFDTAAWDVVMSAGPFPKPPEAIKSYDGKVYLDWVFHRDERQCGTDFVLPHILTRDKHA